MDKVKFPDWTPPDLIRCYEEVKQDDDGDEDLMDCFYRLGTEQSMQGTWTWLLKNQKQGIPFEGDEQAENSLVAHICAGIAWGYSLAKNAEIENPIPLNESNKKLAAIIKKTQSLIDDIEGNYQASKISNRLITRLVDTKLSAGLERNGLNSNLFSIIGWKKKFSEFFEDRKRSLSDKKLQRLSIEDRALFIANETVKLGLIETLKFLSLELNRKMERAGKMSKSARFYMLPYLNRVFQIHFDQVPKEQFCQLVSVVEFDQGKGFNPLTWDDIKPYLLSK